MKNNNWLFIVLVIFIIWFWRDHSSLKNQLEEAQYELYSYEYALGQANTRIEEAKWYAWESYDEMGEALDNLDTVSP